MFDRVSSIFTNRGDRWGDIWSRWIILTRDHRLRGPRTPRFLNKILYFWAVRFRATVLLFTNPHNIPWWCTSPRKQLISNLMLLAFHKRIWLKLVYVINKFWMISGSSNGLRLLDSKTWYSFRILTCSAEFWKVRVRFAHLHNDSPNFHPGVTERTNILKGSIHSSDDWTDREELKKPTQN